jgi:GT2 family glycosyltransferase
MIQYFTSFDINKNIGKAYNESMSLLPHDNDWGCLIDGDTMFLTPNYGNQISDIIKNYENNNIGILTCLTNRTGNRFQRYNGVMSEDIDLKYHRDLALKLQKEHYLDLSEIPRTISGHLMLIQKKVWQSVGGFKEEGLLTVDNEFSRRVILSNRKIFLMQGLYIFHYYRLFTNRRDKSHLIK